ncbi:MAG TPA: hypothetical protein VLD59_05245 [Steroidobacteraceae bacterium]|nr:hypothetical protein [Steroidobacteraceae bacterium]
MAERDLAAAYVRYLTEGSESDEWALYELSELARESPDRAWQEIQRINSIPIDDEAWKSHVHATLGCGALEDLIVLHEKLMLPIVLKAAESDPTIRDELSVIYQGSVGERIWSQICTVLARDQHARGA